MSSTKPIGVFDSGLGGLTCAAELRKMLPSEDIIYFGDTARVPYGTRSRSTILEYAAQDIAFIKSCDVKLIIAACGTVSTAIMGSEEVIPDVPFFGVAEPAAKAAVRTSKAKHIGVTGTPATIRTGAYTKLIAGMCPEAVITAAAAPLFVPLVENGFTDKEDVIVKAAVERYLAPVRKAGVDTLILGCTHYPILAPAIAEFMGADVTLISSGAAAAEAAAEYLKKHGLTAGEDRQGSLSCYTTDSAEMFYENAHSFLGDINALTVERISVEELCAMT